MTIIIYLSTIFPSRTALCVVIPSRKLCGHHTHFWCSRNSAFIKRVVPSWHMGGKSCPLLFVFRQLLCIGNVYCGKERQTKTFVNNLDWTLSYLCQWTSIKLELLFFCETSSFRIMLLILTFGVFFFFQCVRVIPKIINANFENR